VSKANLLGKMLSYSPAVIFSALLQFVTVIVFTHLIDAEAYGRYAIVMVTVQFLDVMLFAWLRIGEMRFHEAKVLEGGKSDFYGNTQIVLVGLNALILCIGIPAALYLVPDEALGAAMVSGLFLLVLKAGVSQLLVRHRLHGQSVRYSLVEIGRSLFSLIVPVVLVVVFGMRDQALLLGAALVFGVILLADLLSATVRFAWRNFDWSSTGTCLRFGVPAVLSVMLADLVALSDRYVIGFFWGEGTVGIYAVASNIARQSIALLFSVTLVVAYPLLMQAMEREGAEQARLRLRDNFAVVLALCIPATVGLALTAEHVTVVCLGEEYRAAGDLIPWMAVAAFISGTKLHVYDHVFHLTKRTGKLLLLNVPIAMLNLVLNLVLVPVGGMQGAIAATLASYAFGLVLTIFVATRLMPVPVPFDAVWRILVGAGAMALVLLVPTYPQTPTGLAVMVAAGMAVYALVGLLLDLLGSRRITVTVMGRLLRSFRSG